MDKKQTNWRDSYDEEFIKPYEKSTQYFEKFAEQGQPIPLELIRHREELRLFLRMKFYIERVLKNELAFIRNEIKKEKFTVSDAKSSSWEMDFNNGINAAIFTINKYIEEPED